ncbi:MAG: chromosomal replication initiator protein DnaA [Chthonomonadales bacterium]
MPGDQLQLGDDEQLVRLRRAWERCLQTLAMRINKVTYESYIRPIVPVSLDAADVVLGVANPFAREWLQKRYATAITAALEAALEQSVVLHLRVLSAEDRSRLQNSTPLLQDDAAPSPAPAPQQQNKPRPRPKLPHLDISLPLSERYTFDTFVVGRNNQLAEAAAQAVAASPGQVYNPLFIYGGPGLGKTHLLQAIAHALRHSYPDLAVAYVDGENFTYHYVSALRERRAEEFRRYTRNVDVWLIDDVQFLAGAAQTREEFFHTFNALYQSGRQIVISSDRCPRELRSMDDRLISRFECGLTADIAPPELETRMAILSSRCASEGWQVPDEVIYFIAASICSNIRALEGALTRLIAYSSIMRAPISVDVAQSVLADYLIEKPVPGRMHKGISMETILAAVAQHFGTNTDVLRGRRRDEATASARHMAMFLCREIIGASLAHIGEALGGRDHTTVQRGIARIEEALRRDAKLREDLARIRERLER